MLRDARVSDAKRIAEIYNYYIENTIITFEQETVTETEIAQRVESIIANGYPYLVYEENDVVVAFAYLNKWRTRAAYDITLESSVYLCKNIDHRRGIGSILYEELIKRAKDINIHSLIAGITVPNDTSIEFHKKFHFKQIGTFQEVGYKFNKLLDVDFWQLIL